MKINQLKHQKGNVLFLILIAVALFAALSYAVTQSSRSGGDASKETNVINTASLTQYPNSVRTAVLRMIIAGIDPLDLQFNKPDEFDTAGGFSTFVASRGVFHPQGGSAGYQQVPANLTAAGTALDWLFTADFEVPLLGLSGSGATGNEVIAFASGVTETICSRVNKELNQFDGSIPVIAAGVTITNDRTATNSLPAAPDDVVLDDGSSPNWFSNKAFGCFRNATAGPYVFYYVLAER